MGGMEMLLKSMGLDPKQMFETAQGFLTTFEGIKQTLDRVEANQILILERMEQLKSWPPISNAEPMDLTRNPQR